MEKIYLLHEDYKLIYNGQDDRRHGAGAVISPELAPYVEKVDNVSERILSISIKTRSAAFSLILIQVCAPQSERPTQEKDKFHQYLQDTTDTIGYKEKIIVCGDFIGHVGCEKDNVETVIGAFGIGDRNEG